jgi:predicted XRE-type DNA-binding protein
MGKTRGVWRKQESKGNLENRMNRHIGSSLDDFLEEEEMLAEAEAVAVKRVIVFQLRELMREQNLTTTQMAKWMNTNRSAMERLLDPDNVSVTLLTLARAARALGKRIRIEIGAECSPRVARAASAKQTPLE